MQFRLEELGNTLDPDAFASRVEKEMGLGHGSLSERRQQGGLEMLAVEYRARAQAGPVRILGGYFVSERIGIALHAIAAEGQQDGMVYAWRTVLDSTRRLSQAEAEEVPLRRIRIHTVRSGETFQGLAERYLHDPGQAVKIAEINGMNPSHTLLPGTSIKVMALSSKKGRT